jgi:hypothetical protein
VLPVLGADEFSGSAILRTALHNGPFSKVYVFTAMGLVQWDKMDQWQKLKQWGAVGE